MKRFLYVFFVVVGFLIIAASVFAFIFYIMFGGLNFLIHVPEPQIKYGEFPFKLTYEIDGNVKVIEDVIVCEFDGYKVRGEAGKYRKWKSSLKSGNERITLMDLSDTGEKNEFGKSMLELYFYWGTADYYMSDDGTGKARTSQDLTEVCYISKGEKGVISHSSISAQEAWERYKIKLIKWECSEPIENKFG